MTVVVHYVADVDGLLVRPGAADVLQGVLHGEVRPQVHELRGHDGAGGVLRVFQNFVDALARLRVRVLQDALDHIRRHLLHDVHGVIQIQLVQHFLQLRVGEALDQQLLLVAVQLHEDLRRLLLGQQAEEQWQGLLVIQIVRQLGDVRRLQGQQQGAQLLILFSLDVVLNLLQQLTAFLFPIQHRTSSSLDGVEKAKVPGRGRPATIRDPSHRRPPAGWGPSHRSSFSVTGRCSCVR